MLERFLRGRRARLDAVEAEAASLLTFLGGMAYPEARDRARACRLKGDRAGDRFWSKVAVSIAKRTGREIGVKAADRYGCEEPGPRPKVGPDPEMLKAVQAIAGALGSLARGENAGTNLHNLRAMILNTLDFVGSGPALRVAADDLCRAAEDLAGAPGESRHYLALGVYPPLLEAASAALERFRLAASEGRPRRG